MGSPGAAQGLQGPFSLIVIDFHRFMISKSNVVFIVDRLLQSLIDFAFSIARFSGNSLNSLAVRVFHIFSRVSRCAYGCRFGRSELVDQLSSSG